MNCLTVRENGRILGTPYVGSQAMTWTTRTGTIRSMLGSAIQSWISIETERLAVAGANQQAWLDRVVTVADETVA